MDEKNNEEINVDEGCGKYRRQEKNNGYDGREKISEIMNEKNIGGNGREK